jgi:two-component system CheB/CheR fusion protein
MRPLHAAATRAVPRPLSFVTPDAAPGAIDLRSPMSDPHAAGRTLSLNLLLSMLPVLAVLPLLALTLALMGLNWSQMRHTAQREVQQAARTLAIAVDRDLSASVRELQRLAEFPTLVEGDLAPFAEYARKLVAEQAAWSNIVLVDPDGQQLLNTLRRPGETLPVMLRDHHRSTFRTGAPALSDLYRNTRDGQPSVAIGVPVRREQAVRWVLSARLNPDELARLLSRQAVNPDLVASILDRNRLLVARNRHHERYFGAPATDDLQAAVKQRPSGHATLVTLEGVRVLAAWETLPLGWIVTVGVPQEEIDAPLRRQLGWLALAGLVALGLSLAMSLSLARRLERGVAAAIDDAQALAGGREPPHRFSRVRELDSLFASLRSTRAQLVAAAERESQSDRALRLTAERLQVAVESVDLGTFDWDVRNGTLVQNARMASFYNARPGDITDISQIAERIHPADRERVATAIRSALNTPGDGRYRNEYRVVAEGGPRWIQIMGQVMFDTPPGGGRPQATRFIGVGLDITERKEMELSLREADRRKDEFIAMLSHELRNPLTPIANALTILRMQPGSAAASERALAIAERQVQQMKRLIDDLLDISRITRGKIALQRAPLDLTELTRHAAESVQPAAAGREQTLRLHLPPHPVRVDGDRARLLQVIENLLTNAVKFSAHGGLIELSLSHEGGAAPAAVLTVRDEGVGIPPEKLNSVFEIFTQLDATIDRSQGGLGIGLALVRRLVQMHGGSVAADSRGPGTGATFTVRLPALADDASVVDAPAVASAESSASHRRVMVVDDNADAADTLVALLTLLGHEAQAVYGGEDALALAARFAPDTVLLDIGLPGISGLEVGRRLRARVGGARLTLIAVSGYAQDTDRAATLQAGFDNHLVKPVSAADLERALQRDAAQP